MSIWQGVLDVINGKVDIIDAFHDVPTANSADNVVMSDVIGNKNDTIQLPYVGTANSILAYLNNNYQHVHGTVFVYPDHAGNVVLTAGAGAWDLTGAITQVIPAATLGTDFDLHWINISGISGNGEIQIDIYTGAALSEVLIASTRTHRNAVQSQEGAKRIQTPQIPANTRISCRLSDSTGGALSCAVSFEGHFYV